MCGYKFIYFSKSSKLEEQGPASFLGTWFLDCLKEMSENFRVTQFVTLGSYCYIAILINSAHGCSLWLLLSAIEILSLQNTGQKFCRNFLGGDMFQKMVFYFVKLKGME